MQNFNNTFWNQVGGYGPNLLGAIIALVVGLLVAWIVAAVCRRIFEKSTLDERVAHLVYGDTERAENFDSARWLSRAVFWVITAIAILAAGGLLLLGGCSRASCASWCGAACRRSTSTSA